MAFSNANQPLRLSLIGLFAVTLFLKPAAAQVVIPYGNFDSDFEKYLVAAVTLAVLVFAMWRYFKNR
jgi:hypothetical protein